MICTATAGVALLSRQKCPKATWGNPQDPDAPERPPGKPKGGFPERGLNGAYKVPQAHLPPPNLPRFGGGERPPFFCKPPAPLTITMGQRLTVFASPNTPRVLLSVYSCQPIRAPFPPSGKGVGGKGRCAAATLGAILCAVRIDFRLPPEINPYPAQPATGVLGQRPKRVLLTFARTKVSPRRVGVQTMISIKLAPPQARRNQAMSIRR